MVDSNATHNFLANIEVRQLGFNIKKDQGKLNAANLRALETSGIAKQVPYKMRPWDGNVTFTVALLDDFDVVLGLEILIEA